MAFTWHTSMVWTGDGTGHAGMEYRDGGKVRIRISCWFFVVVVVVVARNTGVAGRRLYEFFCCCCS